MVLALWKPPTSQERERGGELTARSGRGLYNLAVVSSRQIGFDVLSDRDTTSDIHTARMVTEPARIVKRQAYFDVVSTKPTRCRSISSNPLTHLPSLPPRLGTFVGTLMFDPVASSTPHPLRPFYSELHIFHSVWDLNLQSVVSTFSSSLQCHWSALSLKR
ncbi:hypothetical protein EGR_04845 [Echinococcus granulosus]|uniref:Uncharacterized protein n=1 Tax=Echinococcus granulosus TaxID=6210 RepID=W6UPS5_ECHGR|nr:hypothetical protein EGR_04845 [Echinococcus granulosus]EUB60287.1 hypothetical protein EGR_04845 [Echinococcus granulosus]